MIRRLLLALSIALVSGAWFGGHGGGGSSAPSNPLATLIANTIATCGHGCWVRLNASTGGGLPTQVLATYGLTSTNFNGAANDPWSTLNGPNGAVPGGVISLTDANLFSFSAPAIRKSDGKICAAGTGGHFASAVSAVFCFDPIAAAANLNGGGSGGVWTMPVKPARLLSASDTKPAWQTQNAADSGGTYGWWMTNPDGVQMPIACHEYWSNRWIGHVLVWSGTFCGYGGGGLPGSGGRYNDDTHALDFPLLTSAFTTQGYTFHGSNTIFGPNAINDLDNCNYTWVDGSFGKYCSLTSGNPVDFIGVGGGGGPDVQTGFILESEFVPDPANPVTRRWFLETQQGNCFSTGLACFYVWRDTGVTPNTSYTQGRIFLTNTWPVALNIGATGAVPGMAYDSVDNALYYSSGGPTIYKVADATTGQLSTNTGTNTPGTGNWMVTTYPGCSGGIVPGSTNSNAVALQSLEPAYHALLLAVIPDATGNMEVDLCVK